MIFNAYAVLAIFVGLLELALGVWVVCLTGTALARRRTAFTAVAPVHTDESRASLLLLLAFALLGASVASWPLLYLLLASYIPEWLGVMCVQGVSRVGTGSEGAGGWLPTLVRTLEFTKPALVFAAGAWLVLHVANRRTRTSPLEGRVLGALLVVGLLATLDAGTQLAYVGIPKKERFLAAGCCVVPTEFADRTTSPGFPVGGSAPDAPERKALVVAFYALSGVLVVGTRWASVRSDRAGQPTVPGARAGWSSDALTLAAFAALPVAVLFLSNVAAPAFLGQPDHRCAHCLLTKSPLGVAVMASYLVGAFATGWAGVVDRFASSAETASFVPPERRRLLDLGTLGYLAALVLLTGRLLVA